jgi:hypothetical protein
VSSKQFSTIAKPKTSILLLVFGFSHSGRAQETIEDQAALQELQELMTRLPVLDLARPQPVTAPKLGRAMTEGLWAKPGRVVLAGTIIFDKGPVDGLEVIACLKGGKNHEALLWTPCDRADLVKAAFIAAFEAYDGVPAPEAGGLPARGTPLRVRLLWREVDPLAEEETWLGADVSTLVRGRHFARGYPPLPYIYTGSQIRSIVQTLPDGSTRRVERFMLQETRSLVVNFDEPDALLASPFPMAARDNLYEVNTAAQPPPPKSAVYLVFEPVDLPLVVRADESGILYDGEVALDDGTLAEMLRQRYGAEATPTVRALGIQVDASVPRAVDLALRRRLLELAVAAEVWVVPVFIIKPTE